MTTEEMELWRCPICNEVFDAPVWHCPICAHHYHVQDRECKNCHEGKQTKKSRSVKEGRP